MGLKNCENNDLRKQICQHEAQLSYIKSYVNCEVSILTNRTESILDEFGKRINFLQGKERNKIKLFKRI